MAREQSNRGGGGGGGRGGRGQRESDLKENVIHINRVAKVVKGGRRFSFAALVAVGDQQGGIGLKGLAHGTAMTLRDGITRAIKESIPEVSEVIDTTDHDAGENPFYT